MDFSIKNIRVTFAGKNRHNRYVLNSRFLLAREKGEDEGVISLYYRNDRFMSYLFLCNHTSIPDMQRL